jgi:hypothetical protein
MTENHTRDGVSTMQQILGEWEARIEYSCDPEWMLKKEHKSAVFYDSTVEGLRNQVGNFLSVNAPGYFSNIGDHLAGRWSCFFADGVKDYPFLPPDRPPKLWEGWGILRENLNPPREDRVVSGHILIRGGDFETTVTYFVTYGLVPRKSPSYRSQARVEKELQSYLLEQVLREKDESQANDLVARGWQIIALEYEGEATPFGELMNRKARFVMGHSDLQAALATSQARDTDVLSQL